MAYLYVIAKNEVSLPQQKKGGNLDEIMRLPAPINLSSQLQ